MGRLDVQQEHSRLGGHLLGKALRLPTNIFKDDSFSVSRHQLFYLLHISESYKNLPLISVLQWRILLEREIQLYKITQKNYREA